MNSRVDVVILAAGQGKRMRSALPKVLHPLAGRPLLAHVVDTARELKPSRVCIVYGQGGEQVPRALRAKDLVFARQARQLGTGHALKQALPHIGRRGRTLVLYGDVPLVSVKTLRRMLRGSTERLVVLIAEADEPDGYGRIVRNGNGAITGIVEQKDATPDQRRITEINTGIMALPSGRLASWLGRLSNRNGQCEYYLTDVVALALKDGIGVSTVSAQGLSEVLGVNSKAQLAQLERIVQERTAHRLLDAGVTLADPRRLDVRGALHCGRDVRIDVNCVFEGAVELGDGADIGANCVIKDAVVGAGTRIAPFTWIDGARIGAHCIIGPFARIRPNTALSAHVHVGNFVEVKASDIAARSKANHLAYIGDSSVGEDVNIGAGTITCNYDGVNKHRTVIGDDAFIGSNVALVAPVTVGSGATIGAGSVITKEAPAGQLTLSRAKQVSISGWTRPRKPAKAAK
jgi:bifunctional UDP-N-acetylglucosamine pyrophosphorylase/glucosamine-1-phosphate N-acetyltransferase